MTTPDQTMAGARGIDAVEVVAADFTIVGQVTEQAERDGEDAMSQLDDRLPDTMFSRMAIEERH